MKRFIIVFVILGLFWGAWVLTTPRAPAKPPPAPALTQQVVFGSVVPGKTLKEIVIEFLGAPLSEEKEGGVTTLAFPSVDKEREIYVSLDSTNTVSLVIEPVLADVRFSDMVVGLGDPGLVLYGPYAPLGYNLYVYLSRGTAFLASPNTQVVYERWFFPPVNERVFLAAYARGYSLKPPPQEQE